MTSEQLLDTLDALDEDKLKRFKWHLRQEAHASAADLEKADAIDTVDLMMACCGPERAVQTTLYILRKMKQNHLAEELENELKVHKAPVKMSSSAQVGASVNAPVLTGNTITGPGNIYGSNAAGNVTFTNIVPRTRNYFLQFSYQFTLDPNTVNKQLRLSKGNRVITVTDTEQPYPDHPDRFDHYLEVLCGESVCGRCYWEIEWSGEYGPYISVSYKSISRKGRGKECRFGYNDQSWSLFCTSSSYSFWHNNTVTDLPVKPISRRIGVYVDHSAGTLSFYSVSGDTMSLIHTVQTTFTQPLYPGFSVYYRSSVKLC